VTWKGELFEEKMRVFCRKSKHFLFQLDGHQLKLEKLGLGEQMTIDLEGAHIEFLTKSDGVECVRVELEEGNVIELRRSNPIGTVSIK
jgi:hypothetical protein